jgi:tetratricopeptide (TPR) repeat protein
LDRKHLRKGKYLFLCLAGLIVFSLACSTETSTVIRDKEVIRAKEVVWAREEVCTHLDTLRTLTSQGDFEGAVKKNQEILSLSPKSPDADVALFSLGLLYAHYENPKKDYKQSLAYFRRLVREYPKAPLSEEAKIWIGVLQDIEKSMKVDIEIEEKKKELSQ